ncbi:hypothetical protein M0802_001594 [Mischocyttarus mexicanus]|nr:hypothetical protein M0802_001594 [Mischocyttarus mexicanus]
MNSFKDIRQYCDSSSIELEDRYYFGSSKIKLLKYKHTQNSDHSMYFVNETPFIFMYGIGSPSYVKPECLDIALPVHTTLRTKWTKFKRSRKKTSLQTRHDATQQIPNTGKLPWRLEITLPCHFVRFRWIFDLRRVEIHIRRDVTIAEAIMTFPVVVGVP